MTPIELVAAIGNNKTALTWSMSLRKEHQSETSIPNKGTSPQERLYFLCAATEALDILGGLP